MNIEEIYHFLFETFEGIWILVGAGIVISIILSMIFEVGLRKRYRDRGPRKDDDDGWSLFEDDDEDDGSEDEDSA